MPPRVTAAIRVAVLRYYMDATTGAVRLCPLATEHEDEQII